MGLAPGARLGPYEIVGPLGAGGMGEVYRARDSRLGRDVAVKILPDALASDSERLKRFEREARAAAALSHPHICMVHDIGEDSGRRFIVLELLEGKTLQELLSGRPLPLADLLSWGLQVAEALEAAHAKGIVHRDVKPANIFITERGAAKVLDFGLAKLASPSYDDAAISSLPTFGPEDQLTSAGVALGTALYMSPEQVRGEVLDARSDLFSLGLVLYQMATGRRAFEGPTAAVVQSGILTAPAKPPKDWNPALPRALSDIISKALEKDRDLRYQSAADVRADIARLGRSLSSAAAGAEQHRDRSQRSRVAVAVLPFVNLSTDPENEYFADGITEDVTAQISKIGALKVISRASAMQFKDRQANLRGISERLGVGTLLDGSVRRAGNRVRVVAKLLDARTGEHLWSETYDRELSDVFAIQSDVALCVARALQTVLSPSERERVGKQPTSNMEAYTEYLLGRHHLNKRSDEGLRRALVHFEKAIGLDSSYAGAWAGLADGYNLAGAGYTAIPPEDAHGRAKAAAERAVELDDALPEAHTSLGFVCLHYEWDWPAAERAFQRAIHLNPSHSQAHQWYAQVHSICGRYLEAIESVRHARELDPLSVVIATECGWPYFYMGRHDEALAEFRKALELEPGFALAHYNIGCALDRKGMLAEAVGEYEEGVRLSGRVPIMTAFLGSAYARTGRTEDARAILRELLDRAERAFGIALSIAVVYEALGEKERALDWLEKACDEREPFLVGLCVGQWLPFLSIRSEPRFRALLAKLGGGTPAASQSLPAKPSIVVVPFQDISPDRDNEYFSDGLTEQIISDLSRVQALRVISRSSAMRLKGKHRDIRAIGRDLSVQYLLEGSVRKAGPQLRITCQLNDVNQDASLWAETYRGSLEDVFEIQESVARAIVQALRLRLTPDEEQRLARPRLTDPHAYDSYVRARQEIWRFSKEGLERARQLLKNALAIVGPSELLLATLGHAHAMSVQYGLATDDAPLREAEACARDVFALDPDSAHGLRLRGLLHYLRGDFQESAGNLKRTLAVEPNDPDSLLMLANVYALSGREAAAKPLLERLLEIDPLTPLNHCMPGFLEFLEGRPERALEPYRKYHEMDPDNPSAGLFFGWVLLRNQRVEEACAVWDGIAAGTVFATMGRLWKGAAQRRTEDVLATVTAELESAAKRMELFSRFLAEALALAGQKDAALDWLENSVRLGFCNYPYLSRFDTFLDNIRGEPRFLRLMADVKGRWERFEV